MSWSASFQSREAFESDKPDHASPSYAEIQADQWTFDQYVRARQAAELILANVCVVPGGPDKPDGSMPDDTDRSVDVHVGLAGHANPDHRPRAGWANDYISVTVTQK